MNRANPPDFFTAATVLELARLNGVPVDDEAMASRIARGAAAATTAVLAEVGQLGQASLTAVGAAD